MEIEERRPDDQPGSAVTRPTWWRRFLDRLFSREAYVFGIVTLGMIFVYIYAGQNRGENRGIWDIDYARGLITLLFSVGTIVIAVVLILTAVFSDEDEERAEARFARAKEVLTLLIGVFGTIVGFYFGSATREQGGGRLGPATPASVQSVGGLARGGVVMLDGPNIQDTDLNALRDVPNAVGVVLDNSRVTNSGLKILFNMTNLKWVSIRDVDGITVEGVDELKKAVPNLVIIR